MELAAASPQRLLSSSSMRRSTPMGLPLLGGPRICAASGSTPAPQILDAEMHVEYLCRKFEALSEQLRREEFSREDAERRGVLLASEVQSAEAAAAKRSDALAAELSGNAASMDALRASASGAGRRATLESEKARDEQASEVRLEKECAVLSEKCRSEAQRCEHMLSCLTAQDREAVQERCDHGEVGRHLRQLQVDKRVSLEDLRIAQQRSLLVRSELHKLEASLDSTARTRDESIRETETYVYQINGRCQQLSEHEARIESLVASIEASRSECAMQDRRWMLLQEEDRAGQAHLAALQQELQLAQQDLHSRGFEAHAEVEASNNLAQELMIVERQRVRDAQEAAAHSRNLSEVEASLEYARKGAGERRMALQTSKTRLGQLVAEEEGHTSAASELRRARQSDDMAFDDVQSELQIAFQRRESLGENLALGAQAREQDLTRLRRLRPEISEAEERCRDLEEQLAQRARDLEEEIVQQRHYQQEVVAVSDSILEVQRHEARMEAELHHTIIFPGGASSREIRGRSGSPARSSLTSVRAPEPCQPWLSGDVALGTGAAPSGGWPGTPTRSWGLAENGQASASRIGSRTQSPHPASRHSGVAATPWASPSRLSHRSAARLPAHGSGIASRWA